MTDLFPNIHNNLWQCPVCNQWIRLDKMQKHFKKDGPYDSKGCSSAKVLTGGLWTKQS